MQIFCLILCVICWPIYYTIITSSLENNLSLKRWTLIDETIIKEMRYEMTHKNRTGDMHRRKKEVNFQKTTKKSRELWKWNTQVITISKANLKTQSAVH